MFLTLAMIADKLSEFQTDLMIGNSAKGIKGVRLGVFDGTDDYLYVSEAKKTVTCAGKDGTIRVHQATLGAVFNKISTVIDTIMEWENDLNTSIFSGCSLQDLVDIGRPVLNNPIFITDQREITYATSNDPKGSVDPEWDYLIENGRMPFSKINEIYRDSDFKTIRRVSESDSEPFIFHSPGIIHRGIHYRIPDPSEDSFLGTLVIIENTVKITVGLLHLSRIFIDAINKWTQLHKKDHNMKNFNYIFTNILNGESVSHDEINVHILFNKFENKENILAVIPPVESMPQLHLSPHIESTIDNSYCFEYKEHLLALFSYTQDDKTCLNKLKEIAAKESIRIGVSSPFSDWLSLRSAFKQAMIALEFNLDRVAVMDSGSALNYMISEVSTVLKGCDIFHPALKALGEHDAMHGTLYYQTLYVFLKSERNLVDSASELYIHRNSLVYRIQRIKELIEVDLDDPSTRQHLLLSFLCTDHQRSPGALPLPLKSPADSLIHAAF